MSTSPIAESSEPHIRPVVTNSSLRRAQKHLVEEATNWARSLIRLEARGPGDIPGAMHRLSSRYGVSYHSFWTLRYRPPRDIAVSIYFALKGAYEAELARQLEKLEQELAQTKLKAGASGSAVAAAQAVLDAANQGEP